MGVVNVTTDSFSDGGRYLLHSAAVEHGLELRAQGADLIDVGGESTRPGAARIDPEIEARRIAPVIADLAAAGVSVSVDTMRASVAAAAIEAGAAVVNDVSGGRADPDMARVVADARVPWILMHWRSAADFAHRSAAAHYGDVVADVRAELLECVDAAVAAGVDASLLSIDPGLGFAKTGEHNWALLKALPEFVALGLPVLVGASRKRFLGTLLADADGPRAPDGREVATAAVSALAAAQGAWGVRVHDVRSSLDAVAVASAWQHGGTANTEDGTRGPGE
ncbi:dihydropteroate synthase [Aldersonia sp. NBC_00410]|uniref:dihydropteroate synthase n=1 Tax=Aldersonia sp. NBC_00410 TaxID=2975954 RepID=UPI0022568CE2|nr:dihydropteroate synthase [Aldersonia sp. NBC_00410]MCX5043225.1 dihydropteroate synthase [Aldersonia sp. NBC_00410]